MSATDEPAGDEPREWIFTFGFGHAHPTTGEPLHGRFVRFAGNEIEARDRMVSFFGVKWAFQYPARVGADPAGGGRFELVELPEDEFPPQLATDAHLESQVANHAVLRVHELRAPCFMAAFEHIAAPDFMLRAVLVSGSIGDYTVYLGIGSAQWVADYGNKLPFGLAAAFFPGLDERRYRE